MLRLSDPAVDCGFQPRMINLAPFVGGQSNVVALPEAHNIAPSQPSVGWKNHPSKKWNPCCDWYNLRPMLVDCQAQCCKPFFSLLSPGVQCGFLVGKEQEIIAIAKIRLAMKFLFDKEVEWVEIDIGPELRGEVANG